MPRMTDADIAILVLERAAVRIAPPTAWCRGALARDGHHPGRPCGPTHQDARSWSMLGAVHYELAARGMRQVREDRLYRLLVESICAAVAVSDETPGTGQAVAIIRDFNDSTSKGGALRALEAARLAFVRAA